MASLLVDLTSQLWIKSSTAHTSVTNSTSCSFIRLFGPPYSVSTCYVYRAEPRIVGRIEALYDRGEIVTDVLFDYEVDAL